jgi:DNA-binding response OmpR family regulator
MMRILLVEDDRKAAQLLARGLVEEGFAVDLAHSTEEAERCLAAHEPDLLVLDWMLPGQDGASWCQALRQRGLRLPVLMLTARDALLDRVAGLDMGADDYLTKPFAFEELLARLRSLRRRSDYARPPVLQVADLRLDPLGQRVARGAIPLDLTRREYAILELLMQHAGSVVSRAQLIEQIWKTELIGIDNLIDAHLHKLRRKVDPPGLPALIHTVRGRGFRIGEDRG